MGDTPGKYPWIDFQGGMDGMFPEFLYDDLFKDLVYAGFIVTYTNPHLLIEHQMNNFSLWSEQAYFYQKTGPSLILEDSGDQVDFDTSKMSIICHSSGCQPSKEFANHDPSSRGVWLIEKKKFPKKNFPKKVFLKIFPKNNFQKKKIHKKG